MNFALKFGKNIKHTLYFWIMKKKAQETHQNFTTGIKEQIM